MKLLRNSTLPEFGANGGKYTVIDNRTGEPARGEFFCLALKDMFSQPALFAYAKAARDFDPEYAHDVEWLARNSGPNHPECKMPD